MIRNCNTTLMTLALALLCAGQLHAASFNGKLVKVLDGNTVEVLHDGKSETVRLAQIYAPVKDQPFWMAAKEFIWSTAAHQTVTVRFENYDLYGRAEGEVFLFDGTNLNKLLVRAGFAWQYKGFSNDPDYADLEAEARKAGRGLWGVDNPVPPWEWHQLINRASGMGPSGEAPGTDFVCGSKRNCYEMESCEEAKFYLYACGLSRLDRDGNGVPCENVCKGP